MSNIYQVLDSKKDIEKEVIVLVDLSNFIFHRFHAVSTWCKMSNNVFETDQQYIDMYERMFEKHLLNIAKKCKCNKKWSNLFLMADCPREDIWRNKYYKEYKKNRELRVKQDIIPQIFNKTYSEIIPRLREKNKFNLIKIDTAEADDIVGIAKSYYRNKYPKIQIVIISNDNDYIQLVDEYTTIYNHAFKNLVERIPKEIIDSTSIANLGDVFLTYKILKGDVSDNIAPVSKMTSKKFIELCLNDEALKVSMEDEKFKKNYNTNNLLINLRMTPDNIRSDVEKILQKLKSI
jgi:5'-3' exonuclease